MNSEHQYLDGQRELARLHALNRRITSIARSYELDVADIAEVVDRRIAKLAVEVDRYQTLNNHNITNFPALEHITDLRTSLIEARLALGWTQTTLADQLALKPQQINKYEKSSYESISLSKAIAIGSVLQEALVQRRSYSAGRSVVA